MDTERVMPRSRLTNEYLALNLPVATWLTCLGALSEYTDSPVLKELYNEIYNILI